MALHLKLEDGCWWIVGEAWGKPFRLNTGLPEDQREVAEFAMLGVEREAEAGFRQDRRPIVILGNKTVREAMRAYLAKRLKETGHQMHGSTLRKYTQIEKAFGHYRLRDINQALVDEWLDMKYEQGFKPSSAKAYVQALSSVMKYAEEVGWIAGRSTLRVPNFVVPSEEHLNLPEIERFLRVCIQRHPAYFPTFLFLIDTGARRGEMMRATWDDVSLEDDGAVILRKRHPKSKSRTRTVPLSPRLRRTLESLPWRDGALLRTPFGRAWEEDDMQHVLTPVLRDILEHAGIDSKRRITLHTLRHTFAFQCASYGMDIADISYLLGHSNLGTTMIYRAFVPDIGAATVAKFGGALTGKKVPERALIERAVRELMQQLIAEGEER